MIDYTRYQDHTPGPWLLTDPYDPANSSIAAGEKLVVGGEFDGLMCPFAGSQEEAAANACLVESAPDLLADNIRLRDERSRLREALRDIKTKAATAIQSYFDDAPVKTTFVMMEELEEALQEAGDE